MPKCDKVVSIKDWTSFEVVFSTMPVWIMFVSAAVMRGFFIIKRVGLSENRQATAVGGGRQDMAPASTCDQKIPYHRSSTR